MYKNLNLKNNLMTFQEYINQIEIKRQHNVQVTENDCFKTYNVHNGMVIVLYIVNMYFTYLLPKNRYKDSNHLWTMDNAGNKQNISCFNYKDL